MLLLRHLTEIPQDFGPSVATIGNFDGVHRGHQWVIHEVISRARTLGLTSLAITFDPHPARVIRPEEVRPLITPLPEKLRLLAETGIDAILVLPFDQHLSQMSASTFASDVLKDLLHVVELHEGENFRFGYRAEAGIDSLEKFGQQLGFDVRAYAPRNIHKECISSTRIRECIAAGDLDRARSMLGRSFSISSTPAPGRGYGTRYTVPTINLAPYPELLPANGVYVTSIQIGAAPAAETFQAVTNVGNRPTFGADSFTVESHLLNFHPIPLDAETPVTVQFLRRLRPEIRWPSPEALREQISRDVASARRFFSLCQRLAAQERSSAPQPASLPAQPSS